MHGFISPAFSLLNTSCSSKATNFYKYVTKLMAHCIAGVFWVQNIYGAIFIHFLDNIFVIAACTAGKIK